MTKPKYLQWAKLGDGDVRADWEWERSLDYEPGAAEHDEWLAQRKQETKAQQKQNKLEIAFLLEMIGEAAKDPKTDPAADMRTIAIRRWQHSASGTCVWCGLIPPRGNTMLCQPCNVYRRTYGRPPTIKAVERRRDKLIG
jgi:hypothetical protein